MKILAYLKTFGEEILAQTNSVIYGIAAATDYVTAAAIAGIDAMTDNIYLLTARGGFLDQWAADLLQMLRKPLESDDALRSRIIANLFLANGTRAAIVKAIQMLTGSPPAEIYEPIRDSAYYDSGFFYVAAAGPNSNSSQEGDGPYCARYGDESGAAYVGVIKLQLPGQKVGGGGLEYYDGREYYDSLAWASDGAPQRMITLSDICDAVGTVKAAGVRVYIETY